MSAQIIALEQVQRREKAVLHSLALNRSGLGCLDADAIVAAGLGVSPATVGNWRRRYIASGYRLSVLADRPRGRPRSRPH